MDTKKDKKDIFDILNEMIEDAKSSGLFSESAEEKAEPKSECTCDEGKCNEDECDHCFNTFDPEEFFKGVKEFFGKITSDDIAKPVQTLAELFEAGANVVTNLFEKVGDAIDELNKKYDEAVEANETKEDEEQAEERQECPCKCNKTVDEPYTFKVDDYFQEDESEDNPSVMDFSDDEIESMRKIIEEEYQRRFPEKCDKQTPVQKLTTAEFVKMIEDKIKEKDFVFSDSDEKELKIEFTIPVSKVGNIATLFSEATDSLYTKHKFSTVHISGKGINDNISIVVYIKP